MSNHNHFLWSASALLIAAMAVTFGTSTPLSAQTTEKFLTDEEKVGLRIEDETKLKDEDTAFTRQANAQASQYRKTAAIVKSQGGDPKPLLDAAAYFEDQARISR